MAACARPWEINRSRQVFGPMAHLRFFIEDRQLVHEHWGIGWQRSVYRFLKLPHGDPRHSIRLSHASRRNVTSGAAVEIPPERANFRNAGRCMHCGYDLRATPARCPECGEVPAAPPLERHRLRTSLQWLRQKPLGLLALIAAITGVTIAAARGIRFAGDAVAFRSRAYLEDPYQIVFCKPPEERSLRYVARLKGDWTLTFTPGGMPYVDSWTPRPRGIRFQNIKSITMVFDLPADVWLREFARPDSGFVSVKSLYINGCKGTDAGMTELARADSGLRALTDLDVVGPGITDVGLKELARADSGLKTLRSLAFKLTDMTDAGVKELVRSDSGLRGLKVLVLQERKITQEGLAVLADRDSGLKELESLDLCATSLNSTGFIPLARPDGGLKSLVKLNVASTDVDDRGLIEFSRRDTSLPALSELNLWETHVTYLGVAALRKSRPGLKLILSPSAEPPPAPFLVPGPLARPFTP